MDQITGTENLKLCPCIFAHKIMMLHLDLFCLHLWVNRKGNLLKTPSEVFNVSLFQFDKNYIMHFIALRPNLMSKVIHGKHWEHQNFTLHLVVLAVM